ncbi:MAG: exodeoxyribonuclease V subunit gamma [Oscillospiraceae bacterium]|nr:exodeoxyribonuclease V subunit gamma [Oscillospiraceae bacterium]
MLQLILGKAGTGKTTYLHNLLRDFVQAGRRDVILLVPEQDSFNHERALLALLGSRDAQAVEVLSFTRLADSLFRACGGRGGRVNLTDAQCTIAMHLAIEAVRDKLDMFARANERMLPGLLRLRNELSMAGTTPQAFYAAALSLNQPKLRELGEIMQAYDAVLHTQFGGHCDALQGLLEALDTPEGRAFFHGRVIAIDSFMGFTPQELRILQRVMEHSEAVYVTLCFDKLDDTFEHTQRTYAELRSLAQQADVRVKVPITCDIEYRPLHEEMLRLTVCEDVEAECSLVAAQVKSLLREGLRCRDIAIVARNSDSYEQPMFAALRRAGVPLFEDRRQPVAAQPLMRMVAAALDIAQHGFTADAVMRWLKTGLSQLDDEDIALLEEYALLWRVQGNRWLTEWTAHPKGLGQSENQHSDLLLAKLNRLRDLVVAPLQAFRESLRDCTGLAGAQAVDKLLQDAHIPVGLKKLRATLPPPQAQELSRIWELLMELLDQLADGLGEQPVGAARFCGLFGLILQQQTLGQLPQSLDAVTFGSAERVRLNSPKAVFVLGMNEGVFPQLPAKNSLVGDRDRAALTALGLRMQDNAPQQLAMERMVVYRTLTAAREQLHISWALRTSSGDELAPSPVLRQLREDFPAVQVQDAAFLPPEDKLHGHSAAFALLCEEQPKQSALYAALHDYFSAHAHYAPRLAALQRTAREKPDSLRMTDSATATALFGGVNYLSPSRVESYARCPFAYYCQYGLKATARNSVDYNPLLRGDILHWLFERLFTCYGCDELLNMTPSARAELVNAELDDYAAEHFPAELPARVTYLFNRLRGIAASVFERVVAQFRDSAFRPIACELRIAPDSAVQPYRVQLSDGSSLRLGGTADRVDCAEFNGQRVLRVVDYKTGSRKFNLGELSHGLGLQLPVYLLALQQNGYKSAAPAGVMIQPAKDPPLNAAKRDRSAEEIAREKFTQGKPDGFLIAPDENPHKLPVMLQEDWARVQREIHRVLDDIVHSLRQGEIPALPAQEACDWCDYQAVCGRESDGAIKEIPSVKFEESLTQLKEVHPDGV